MDVEALCDGAGDNSSKPSGADASAPNPLEKQPWWTRYSKDERRAMAEWRLEALEDANFMGGGEENAKSTVSRKRKRDKVNLSEGAADSLAEALLSGSSAWGSLAVRRRAAAYPNAPNYLTTATAPPATPPRKLCVATGLPAAYRDPHSILAYASIAAYQHIQTKIPLWARNPVSRIPYFDAVKKAGEAKRADRALIQKLKADAWRRRKARQQALN